MVVGFRLYYDYYLRLLLEQMREVILAILTEHQIVYRANSELVADQIEKTIRDWASKDLNKKINDTAE